MTTPTLRGYGITQVIDFINSRYDPETRRRLIDGFPPEVKAAMGHIKPAEWCPRSYMIAALRAVASAKTSERDVYDELVLCGEYIAAEATNTFLRLLMKILTPKIFASKIPDFWSRDQRGGHFEVDTSSVSDSSFKLRLVDVEGYDHVGVINIGWMKFSLAAMGKEGVTVTQSGWSLATPGPREVDYVINWT